MGLPGALTPGTIIGRHYIIGDLLNMGALGPSIVEQIPVNRIVLVLLKKPMM